MPSLNNYCISKCSKRNGKELLKSILRDFKKLEKTFWRVFFEASYLKKTAVSKKMKSEQVYPFTIPKCKSGLVSLIFIFCYENGSITLQHKIFLSSNLHRNSQNDWEILRDNITVFNASYVYFFLVLSFLLSSPWRQNALLYWNIFVKVNKILTLELPMYC